MTDLDLPTYRVALVAACADLAGVHAYPYPPEQIELPAAVVHRIDELTYHSSHAGRREVTFVIRVMVARTGTEVDLALDELIGWPGLASTIEAATGPWRQVVVIGTDGAPFDVLDGSGAVIARAVDLTVRTLT